MRQAPCWDDLWTSRIFLTEAAALKLGTQKRAPLCSRDPGDSLGPSSPTSCSQAEAEGGVGASLCQEWLVCEGIFVQTQIDKQTSLATLVWPSNHAPGEIVCLVFLLRKNLHNKNLNFKVFDPVVFSIFMLCDPYHEVILEHSITQKKPYTYQQLPLFPLFSH